MSVRELVVKIRVDAHDGGWWNGKHQIGDAPWVSAAVRMERNVTLRRTRADALREISVMDTIPDVIRFEVVETAASALRRRT